MLTLSSTKSNLVLPAVTAYPHMALRTAVTEYMNVMFLQLKFNHMKRLNIDPLPMAEESSKTRPVELVGRLLMSCRSGHNRSD